MESTLRRIARRLFAKAPPAYLFLLKALGGGPVEKHLYLSMVRKGDVVIDVGANVGYFSMLFADATGKGGQVHYFEPIPSTFQRLSENIRRFPSYRNVYVNCVAVGDRTCPALMFLPQNDHAQAALVRHLDGSWKDAADQVQSIEVEMIRLDDYAAGLNRIDFVKCDVEGAELLVLRGAESTLRRCRPKLFLEMNEEWMRSFGWKATEVFLFLRRLGYAHFYAVNSQVSRIEKERFSGEAILCSWEELDGLA
jgi:FkbM family methyltransferase